MPSGKAHKRVNLILLPLFLVIGLYYYFNITSALTFAVVYIYCTLWLHPDLDLANQIKLLSLNGIMTLPFRLLYAPFFRHRGISHTLIGTISRILCLVIFVTFSFLMSLFIYHFLSTGQISFNDIGRITASTTNNYHGFMTLAVSTMAEHSELFIAGLLGITISDLSHLALDKLI